jgi:FKBP-type peptidyl-prolyl cis-trans isomerase FkpA/FKBP-type peptidyl-prolyl cis-trans isomerase FklB
MLKVLTWSLVAVLATVTVAAAAGPEPTTEEQKVLYALGIAVSQSLTTFNLSETELEMVKVGISDGVLHKTPKADLQLYGPRLQELQRTRMAAVAAEEKKAGQAFLAKAAAEQGATKTASGLIIKTLTPGKGASPKPTDKVKVHYQGTLTDGTVFDSSVQRGEPVTFPLNGVIPCWIEGVQMMKVGGKSRLVCPASLAYGDRGAPPRIKPGATLVFEVELLAIEQ